MTDEYATLRAAHKAGCRIQAWTLNHEGERTSANGDWRVVHEPQFTCPAHLYRIHPDDLALLPTEPVAVAYVSQESLNALETCRNDDHNGCVDVWMRPTELANVPLYTTPTEPAPDREDAARYRWLRDRRGFERVCDITDTGDLAYLQGEVLDWTIDAARQEQS